MGDGGWGMGMGDVKRLLSVIMTFHPILNNIAVNF